MPPFARLATDLRSRAVLLIASRPPSLHAARRRLGLGLWWYVLALSLLAAVASVPGGRPLRFPRAPEVSWIELASPGALASVAVRGFAVGFVLTFGGYRRGGSSRHRYRVAAAGALTIVAIEVVRWLWRTPVRPMLVVVGALAAVAGAVCYDHAFARRRQDHALGSVIARVIPLELPLTGAALLLVPALWLVSQRADALPLAALLGCFGASLLASARISRGPATGGAWTHAAVAGAWGAIAMTPAWLERPTSAALLVAGFALLAAAHAFLPAPDAADRRFEGPAVRRALALLVAYVIAAALWPIPSEFRDSVRPTLEWTWGTGGARGALEHATVFTLVGYVVAALRGRRDESGTRSWNAVAGWIIVGAAIIEFTRGFHPALVGGAARALVAVIAAALGTAIYTRHRDHIRAWRAAGGSARIAGEPRASSVGRVGLVRRLRP